MVRALARSPTVDPAGTVMVFQLSSILNAALEEVMTTGAAVVAAVVRTGLPNSSVAPV